MKAEVSVEKIPTRVPVELAVAGGEDYQLLCTVEAQEAPLVQQQFEARFGRPLYPIGRIVEGEPVLIWRQNGQEIHPDWKGFTHF